MEKMENKAHRPLPPKLEVTGAWRNDPEVADALVSHFYNEAAQVFPGETPPTPEYTKQLTGLGSAFLELGNDLGLDLRERMPTPDRYHFFTSKNDFDAAMASMEVMTEKTLDAMTLPSGIFVVDRGDDFINMCIAAHETVHFLAQKKVGTGRDYAEDDIKNVNMKSTRSGYRHQHSPGNETFQGLDEIATEFAYLHLLNGGYWDRQSDLPKGGDRNPTFYTSLDIIGDELVQAAAQDLGADPLSIVRSLEIDVLTGKSEGLRLITDHIKSSVGTEGVRKLVHAPTADPKGRFKQLAEDLKLPGAVVRIDGLEQGKPAGVLMWVRTRKKVGSIATTGSATGESSTAGNNSEAIPLSGLPSTRVGDTIVYEVPDSTTINGPIAGGVIK